MEEEDRYTRITLRIPKDLHVRLEAAAADTSKSLNAEIVSRLTAAIDLPDIAAFQLRKSLLEFDAAAARAETLTTSLHLFETALALKMAVAHELHPNLSPLKPGTAEKWNKDADDAIARAQEVLSEQGDAISELEAAGGRIDEARKAQLPIPKEVMIVGNLGTDRESIHDKVIIRQSEPVAPKPTSRGPTRSPNARKPKS